MRSTLKTISASALVVAAIQQVHAQYTAPPPPAPFAGFLNDYLRQDDPYLAQWDIGGTERLRAVSYQGYAIPGTAGSVDFRANGANVDNGYILSRLRFHAGYTEKWWNAYVEGQSSMVADDKRYAFVANKPPIPGTKTYIGNGPESDTIDLHQAYLFLGNHKEFPVSLTAGRQELSYGDERLVGAFGWNNIGRSFDAIKIRGQTQWFNVDVFSGHPVIPTDGQFDVDNQQDWLSGAYATLTKVPDNLMDLYFLSRNASRSAANYVESPQFPQPNAQDIYTVGGRLKSKPAAFGGWDYTVEGAYQFGNFAATYAGNRLTQDAYMFVALGGYTFENVWATPRLGLEYNYASGDSNANDSTHGTFVNLFPTNHKFFGSMDMVSLQNIQDVGAILTIKPKPTVNISLEGYAFWLANTSDAFYNVGGAPRTTSGYGIHPGYSDFVGSQISLYAGWYATKFLLVEAGGGDFFTGDYVQQSLSGVGGSKDAQFVYAQATVKF